jgi:hypothetical protein
MSKLLIQCLIQLLEHDKADKVIECLKAELARLKQEKK